MITNSEFTPTKLEQIRSVHLCLFFPGPPNFGLSWQKRHTPQSFLMQLGQAPHPLPRPLSFLGFNKPKPHLFLGLTTAGGELKYSSLSSPCSFVAFLGGLPLLTGGEGEIPSSHSSPLLPSLQLLEESDAVWSTVVSLGGVVRGWRAA